MLQEFARVHLPLSTLQHLQIPNGGPCFNNIRHSESTDRNGRSVTPEIIQLSVNFQNKLPFNIISVYFAYYKVFEWNHKQMMKRVDVARCLTLDQGEFSSVFLIYVAARIRRRRKRISLLSSQGGIAEAVNRII